MKNARDFQERASDQCESILNLLRSAGIKGVTNVYFYNHVTKSLGARMSELYERGYKINTYNKGSGVFKYVLISEPDGKTPKIERAEDLLMRIIKGRGGVVTASELKSIMEYHQLIISRKGGAKKRNK